MPDIDICKVQFVVDNPDLGYERIRQKTGLSFNTINKIRKELGITNRKRYVRNVRRLSLKPETIVRKAGYDVELAATMLEEHGYGNMKMSKVLRMCR